jgi:hypothetical protein
MKYHLPYHWADTRLQLGCSAAEKSLERKLGEAQKKYFPLTNGKHGAQVFIGSHVENDHEKCTLPMHCKKATFSISIFYFH